MNHEREKPPHFVMDIGREQLICTPDNTLAYLYENSEYDHIFYVVDEDEGDMRGYHIFRHLIPGAFDEIVMRMINNGYVVNNEEEITKNDLEAYKKSLPDYYELKDPDTEWGNTKQTKAENWGKFVAYLLEQIANGKRDD